MHRAPGGIGLPGQTRSALPCRAAGGIERLARACADEAPTAPELWLPAAVPWLVLLPWLPPLLAWLPPPLLPWPPPPCPPRASAFMLANAKMQISGPNVTRFRILLLAGYTVRSVCAGSGDPTTDSCRPRALTRR